MATISHTIHWASNTEELKKQLLSGTGSIIAMKEAVDKTARSLGGEGLFKAANNTTAAVMQLGGASKLSAAEQARVNTQLDKAIEKYRLMGKEPPAAMLELAKATKQAHEPTVALSAAAGVLAAQLVSKAGSALISVGREALMTSARVETLGGVARFMGAQAGFTGGEINALTAALVRQGITTAQANDTVIQMVRANLSLADATRLATVAQSLARATGENSSVTLGKLIQGTQTLQVEVLRNAGVVIQLDQEYKKFAETNGRTVQSLSAQEKQQIALAAVLREGEKVAGVYGVTNEFVGGKIQSLARHQEEAAKAIGDVFAPAMRVGVDALTSILKVVQAAPGTFATLGLGIVGTSTALIGLKSAAALGVISTGALTAAMAALGPIVAAAATAFAAWKFGTWIGETLRLTDAVEWLAARMMGVSDADINATIAARNYANSAAGKTAAIERQAKELVTLEEKARADAQASMEQAKADALVAASKEKAAVAAKQAEEAIVKFIAAATNAAPAVNLLDTRIQALFQSETNLSHGLDELPGKLNVLSGELLGVEDSAARAGVAVGAFGTMIGTNLGFEVNASIFSLNQWIGTLRQIPAESLSAGQAIMGGIAGALKQLPSIVQQAFTGGGGWSGAFKALASTVGNGITQSLFGAGGALATLGDKVSQFLGKALGSSIGGALGSAFNAILPGIGSLIGPLLGKIGGWFKSLFGGISDDVKQARETLVSFTETLHSSATEAQKLEASLSGWKDTGAAQTLIQVRDAYLAIGKTAAEAEAIVLQLWDTDHPDRAKAALEEINRVLEQQKQLLLGNKEVMEGIPPTDQKPTWQEMERLAKQYGISLKALGPAFEQAKLFDQAQEVVDAFNLLVKGGANTKKVLRDMSDEVQDLVWKSLQTGKALPESMKPMIEQLIKMGLLMDHNGKKLTDLNDLKFTKGPESEFSILTKSINALIVTLGGVPPLVEDISSTIKSVPDLDIGIKMDTSAFDAWLKEWNKINNKGNPPIVTDRGGGPPSFASGSGGLQDFGSGTLAMLHGREAVVTEREMRDGGPVAGSPSLERAVERLEASVARLERNQTRGLRQELFFAVRDGMAQRRGGRR